MFQGQTWRGMMQRMRGIYGATPLLLCDRSVALPKDTIDVVQSLRVTLLLLFRWHVRRGSIGGLMYMRRGARSSAQNQAQKDAKHHSVRKSFGDRHVSSAQVICLWFELKQLRLFPTAGQAKGEIDSDADCLWRFRLAPLLEAPVKQM